MDRLAERIKSNPVLLAALAEIAVNLALAHWAGLNAADLALVSVGVLAVLGVTVRQVVTPNGRVALTVDQEADLQALPEAQRDQLATLPPWELDALKRAR